MGRVYEIGLDDIGFSAVLLHASSVYGTVCYSTSHFKERAAPTIAFYTVPSFLTN
jgi:hypothetical protein